MTGPVALATPVLATVRRVELGAVGRWNISNIKGWEPTPDDMASAVAALGCPAVRRPVLKLGHTGEPGAGDPALGYIDNMAVTDDGQVLVGDYAGIPGWMATVDAAGNSVLASAYPDRSGEWEHDYVCQLGHTHPFVLHAMALLGVVRPGIGTLQSLHDLYSNAPEVLMPAASLPSTDGKVSSAATTDDVRRSYYSGPGSNWALYIREMYVDPAELIVQNDADESLTRVAYTIAADGTVTFGDPQTVKVQYVAAMAAAAAPVIAFASKAESRPGDPPKPGEGDTPAVAPPTSDPNVAPDADPGLPAGPAPTTPPGTPALPPTPAATTTEPAPPADPATSPPADPAPQPPAEPGPTHPKEEDGMADLKEGLRQRLGIKEDVGDDAYLAALDEALNERAEQPELVAASANVPVGFIAVPKVAWEELQAAAGDGVKAAAANVNTKREQVLTEARDKGRIRPASIDAWRKQYDVDPDGTTRYLANAPQVVPVTASGYTGGGDDEQQQEDLRLATAMAKDLGVDVKEFLGV